MWYIILVVMILGLDALIIGVGMSVCGQISRLTETVQQGAHSHR
jgi:hypothetical protein